MPAFWWIGAGNYSQTQAGVPSNWTQNPVTLAPSTICPPAGSDVIFDAAFSSADCNNFMTYQTSFGYTVVTSFASITLKNGYSGDVNCTASPTIGSLTMDAPGAFNPYKNATVTSLFDWEAGTIARTAYHQGGTLFLVGTTVTIEPDNAGEVKAGLNVSMENGATGSIYPGIITFLAAANFTITNSTLNLQLMTPGNGTLANIRLEGLPGTFTATANSLILNQRSQLLVKGPGELQTVNSKFVISGGVAEVFNNATVRVTYDKPETPVVMSSGSLRLHTGSSVISSFNVPPADPDLPPPPPLPVSVSIGGGSFVVVGSGATQTAKIDATVGFAGGTISYEGVYSILEVTKDVTWTGGTFKPRVDVTTNALCDTWLIGGNLTIPVQNMAAIAAVTVNWSQLPGGGINAAFRWTVIRINGTAPATKPQLNNGVGPAYKLFVPPLVNGVTDWQLGI